jgi:uncharacterized protein (UPF0335 family)
MKSSAKVTKATSKSGGENEEYVLRISRLTIDKLGVKLYDKVSAVVAELIANGYDADAEKVTVRLPLGVALAKKDENKNPVDLGYVIEVEDDGHGMTPQEAQDFYLEVGRDRRLHKGQGSTSRDKQRPVMGRKGIGKLAPFGICSRIEVLSAGGKKSRKGYLVTHFYMDYGTIVTDKETEVPLERGSLDRTYKATSGTTIRLSNFLPKIVPNAATFYRQVAVRFVFARSDFKILVQNTILDNQEVEIKQFHVPILQGTRIDLSRHPLITDEGEKLPVSGWIALAKEAYKNEEMTGVRVYARNKIVAVTRDFEHPAGYTGEYTIRSYLVGEIHADWLDEGEDLIRSDRQGILWDSDYGMALKRWGAELIKRLGAIASEPRRKRTRERFLEKSSFVKRARSRFVDDDVIDVAVSLAKQIGSFAAEDELEDEDYIAGLTDMILSVAPHKALIQAFQDFSKEVAGGDVSLDRLLDLFGKARVAEMASYSQIAAERVRVIQELEKVIRNNSDEAKFQQLIADAPWLVEPTWTVITKNQSLKTFKSAFEQFWKRRTGEDVTLAIEFERKRPDFTLVSVDHMLHIVEIKSANHTFDDHDMERMMNYVEAFDEFFDKNKGLVREFSRGWRIDLVTDNVELRVPANKYSFRSFEKEKKVERITWEDFLARTKIAHEMFLEVSEKLSVRGSSTGAS